MNINSTRVPQKRLRPSEEPIETKGDSQKTYKKIPGDILKIIFFDLDLTTYGIILRVSKRFNYLATEPIVQEKMQRLKELQLKKTVTEKKQYCLMKGYR